MSKSNITENDTLDSLIRWVDPTWRANANRYIALYTADPGDAWTAITNEATFWWYARVSVVASSGFAAASWWVTSNTWLVQFPECTSWTEIISHFGIVTTASWAGQIIYSGVLASSRSVSSWIQLQFWAGNLQVTED